VSVLKAGSTFLRMIMTMSEGEALVGARDLSSLRLGTFCAEPVNEAVHVFAQRHLTPYYINSYWATEHGGVVWSRCHGSLTQPLQPDTRAWPLPWIAGDVMQRTARADSSQRPPLDASGWCIAADGEIGDVVIRQRFPYLALTVWQSDGFGTAEWAGDVERWGDYFHAGAGYVQGDVAIRHVDGAYTFHGRSDEVHACMLCAECRCGPRQCHEPL
jgi:acrylyl-CoA reductase (NADPH)/3-hydroxypropionyl-CoA dehydratase/3-hydroxypropionyl-CoA synthetase